MLYPNVAYTVRKGPQVQLTYTNARRYTRTDFYVTTSIKYCMEVLKGWLVRWLGTSSDRYIIYSSKGPAANFMPIVTFM